jgi:hypothetical protein
MQQLHQANSDNDDTTNRPKSSSKASRLPMLKSNPVPKQPKKPISLSPLSIITSKSKSNKKSSKNNNSAGSIEADNILSTTEKRNNNTEAAQSEVSPSLSLEDENKNHFLEATQNVIYAPLLSYTNASQSNESAVLPKPLLSELTTLAPTQHRDQQNYEPSRPNRKFLSIEQENFQPDHHQVKSTLLQFSISNEQAEALREHRRRMKQQNEQWENEIHSMNTVKFSSSDIGSTTMENSASSKNETFDPTKCMIRFQKEAIESIHHVYEYVDVFLQSLTVWFLLFRLKTVKHMHAFTHELKSVC